MSAQESRNRLAIVGCGFMGTAILQGLLNKDQGDSNVHYAAYVRSEASVNRLQKDLAGYEAQVDIGGSDAVVGGVQAANIVMLGCVPSDLEDLLSAPGLAEALQHKLVISLLAGVSTAQIAEKIKTPAPEEGSSKTTAGFSIARVIPSIGAKIGDSVTLLAKSEFLPDAQETVVHDLFERIGSVVCVPERLMNDATAIGAACHALSIQSLDAITDASVAEGLDRNVAMQLAAQSLRSSTNLFCAGGMTPEQLKTAMSTPQGITINSVLNLQAANVPSGIATSVRAAIKYAREM